MHADKIFVLEKGVIVETDNIKDALKEFDGEFDIEELRLMRIKFISEVAN
jgi:ABC-type glutathione transport system ATPase component